MKSTIVPKDVTYLADPPTSNDAGVPSEISNMFGTLLSWGNYIIGGLAVLAILGAAASFFFARQQGNPHQEGLAKIGAVLAGVAVAAGGWSIVNTFI